ncbi:hypothetical protein DSO57_1021279 [Entomophthora muscae]|uniref:Uncharacterized protein n=1 Tax=Entomophthora muscae TaxID=34485 RepID=A0ACC2RUJ4_9FUNG|nr:hypothetical protein DSO57_1021279 [Entomophthora muscae]
MIRAFRRLRSPWPGVVRPASFHTQSAMLFPLANQLCNNLEELFRRNRQWAEKKSKLQPTLFPRLTTSQSPKILWIGCSDSRIPETEIFGAEPGDFFVHRNVANIVREDDINLNSALQYAVQVLKVKHIIICGHYGCGGVKAALDGPSLKHVDCWIEPLTKLCQEYNSQLRGVDGEVAWRRLVHYNVLNSVAALKRHPAVAAALEEDPPIRIHPWVYDVATGLIHPPDTYLLEHDSDEEERAMAL